MAGQVQKSSVDNLRGSDETTVQILVDDLLRLHIQRIETRVVADLFAVADGQLSPSELFGGADSVGEGHGLVGVSVGLADVAHGPP